MVNLKKLYSDPKFSGSFAGKERFIKAVRQKYPHVKRKDILKKIPSFDSYTLHKPTTRPKLFRRVYTKGILYLLQIDLVDMTKFEDQNDDYHFLITIIDTFSKKAWAYKLKRKTMKEIMRVMEPFLTTHKPHKIEFDRGSEFYNKDFKDLLKRLGIQFYSIYSKRKCSIVERFNRTLKTRMYRHFTDKGSHRWIDSLQDLVNGYNESKHRSIGMAPNAVNKTNEKLVRKRLFPKIKKSAIHKTAQFSVGDSVRMLEKKDIFQKGYDQTYTHQVFIISKVRIETYPVMYKVKNYKGEELKGSFYASELQKIDKSDGIWPIESVIRQRTVNGKTESLVKWKGYPDEANSWIDHSTLFNLSS